jgi:hypothetical protein
MVAVRILEDVRSYKKEMSWAVVARLLVFITPTRHRHRHRSRFLFLIFFFFSFSSLLLLVYRLPKRRMPNLVSYYIPYHYSFECLNWWKARQTNRYLDRYSFTSSEAMTGRRFKFLKTT